MGEAYLTREIERKGERNDEANLSMDKAPHIEKVINRDLVTLIMVNNGGCEKTVNQAHNRRSEATILGLPSHIIIASKNPNSHVTIPLWLRMNATIYIWNKRRELHLNKRINLQSSP